MRLNSTATATFRTACLECDLLMDVPALEAGQRAHCPRCGYLVTSHIRDGLRRGLAFALAALVFLSMANAFPFLAFKSAGLAHVMTLTQAWLSLAENGAPVLSAIVLAFIVVIPAIMIGGLALLLTTILRGRPAGYAASLGRMLLTLGPWSMVEVFIIGVIVSLVKIAHMATVVIGISFWAYVAFALCFTAAFASLDKHDLWDAIEGLSS